MSRVEKNEVKQIRMRGDEIFYTRLSDEEKNIIKSKSHTLHFQYLLGFSHRSEEYDLNNDSEYDKCSKIVGVALISDEDIHVPRIDNNKSRELLYRPNMIKEKLEAKHKNCSVSKKEKYEAQKFNIEEDIEYIWVKAGELFYLSIYEFMFLMLRLEYSCFCRFDKKGIDEKDDSVDEVRMVLKNLHNYKLGNVRFPTPTLVLKNNRSLKKYAKAIDVKNEEGKWGIKDEFESKFGNYLIRNRDINNEGVKVPSTVLLVLGMRDALGMDKK